MPVATVKKQCVLPIAINAVEYDSRGSHQKTNLTLKDCRARGRNGVVRWFHVKNISENAAVKSLGESFGFHPLLVKNLYAEHGRPKVEILGDYLQIFVPWVGAFGEKNHTKIERVCFVLSKDILVSFQFKGQKDLFAGSRQKISQDKQLVKKMKIDTLLYILLSDVLENYFDFLEETGETLENMEAELVAKPSKKLLHRLYTFKRQMIELRKMVWPLREVMGILERGSVPGIGTSAKVYFRDLYEQSMYVLDTVETYRDMLSGMLEVYLSSVSNRLNEVMKVLTIISTIFIPLTFISGVYGMNFRFMPEIDWKYGYPFALMVMLLVAVSFIVFFRKRRWL